MNEPEASHGGQVPSNKIHCFRLYVRENISFIKFEVLIYFCVCVLQQSTYLN